jgi:hypothetical protein
MPPLPSLQRRMRLVCVARPVTYSMRTRGNTVAGSIVRCQVARCGRCGMVRAAGVAVFRGCTAAESWAGRIETITEITLLRRPAERRHLTSQDRRRIASVTLPWVTSRSPSGVGASPISVTSYFLPFNATGCRCLAGSLLTGFAVRSRGLRW